MTTTSSADRIWTPFHMPNGRHCFRAQVGSHALVIRHVKPYSPGDPYLWEFSIDGRPQRRCLSAGDAGRAALEALDSPEVMAKVSEEKYRANHGNRWRGFVIHGK